jgi:hypothetical protein
MEINKGYELIHVKLNDTFLFKIPIHIDYLYMKISNPTFVVWRYLCVWGLTSTKAE